MSEFDRRDGKSEPGPWNPGAVLTEAARRFHADRRAAAVPAEAPPLWREWADRRALDSRLQLMAAVAVASAPPDLDEEATTYFFDDAHPGSVRIGLLFYTVHYPPGRQSDAHLARLTVTNARGQLHPDSDAGGWPFGHVA